MNTLIPPTTVSASQRRVFFSARFISGSRLCSDAASALGRCWPNLCAAAAFALGGICPSAAAAPETTVLPCWEKINDAYYTNAPGLISGALDELAAQKTNIDPGSFAYVRAYGLFRLASSAYQHDQAESRLREADQLLSSPQRSVPEVEVHALRSAVDGLLAGIGQMEMAIQFGMACQQEADRALSLAPANGRALLALAQAKGNTPPQYGGDRQEAIARLKQAIGTFSSQPSDGIYQWGEADAYAWMGIFYLKEKDPAQARLAFESALKVRPDFAWVRVVLLPKTEVPANHS